MAMAVSTTTTATKISQICCFGSAAIDRKLQIRSRFLSCPNRRPKLSAVISLEARGTEIRSILNCIADASKSHIEGMEEIIPTVEHDVRKMEAASESMEQERQNNSPKPRTAKLHDFCLGIPFGGIVLCGSIVGFIFSKNPATLSTGVLFGGALLALSTLSLKIWKQGKSSLPFILGQAALSTGLLWKNFQTLTSTKKLFPTGLYAFICAGMLSFYLYVVISGGNPPPKKKSAAAVATP